MNSNNVVIFPGNKSGKLNYIPPKNVEEILENITKDRVEQIEQATQFLIEVFQENLQSAGFQFDFPNDPLAVKEMALIIESMRGLLYHFYKIDHPAHVIADEFFETDSKGSVSYKDYSSLENTNPQEEIFTTT